jgi:hypothetical protein
LVLAHLVKKKADRKDYSLPHHAKIRRPEETIIIILMHMARKAAESVKRTRTIDKHT